jgi:uncharacterized protein YodC (DUF2158 family)
MSAPGTPPAVVKKAGKFKPGDTCYLKSGSPKMSVLGLIDDEILVCWVHYDTGRPFRGRYPPIVLQREWT